MKVTKRILAVLLALVMVVALCACGGNGKKSSSGDKVLHIGTDGEPSALDSVSLAGGNGIQFVGWAVYGTLWKYTTEGDLDYLLAESYETSDDGLTVTIHLRDTGFNNGDKFTAEDALFSLKISDQTMGDRTPAMDLENSYAEDDQTLVLKLKYTSPTLIDDIGVISMLSEDWTENYTNDDHIYTDVLCCGPYYIEEGWTAGNDMVLLKNENYWNADNLAYDEIDVSFVAEETTRYLSFDQGDYDICYLSDSSNIDKAATEHALYEAPVQLIVGVVIDTENPDSPYKNQNLRLAIMSAVDVDSIVENICGSAYTKATSCLPSTNWGYKDESYTYDVDAAKAYVAAYTEETGDANPSITLTVHEGTMDENIAEAIQGYLSDAGIACEIEVLDFGSFFMAMDSNILYCYLTQYSGSQDPGGVLNSWNPENIYTMFSYPDDITELITKGCYTVDTQENRTEYLYELQDALHDFGKILPIYEGSICYALADDTIDITHSVQADGYLFPDFITVNG